MSGRVFRACLVLALPAQAMLAQQEQGLIRGRVTSEAGAPVAGARVILETMSLAVTTNDSGVYRLTLPAGRANGQQATLTVRLLGFKPKSAAVVLLPADQTVNFVLSPQAVVLQQVVITGEGIITTNEKLGATVNTVSGETVVNSNETNLVNGLAAKAPNVMVQSQSSDPGASASIQIRGLKSFNDTGQPLFVVDGVPLDNSVNGGDDASVVTPNRIADVNPNDIESLTILKGAAASAIYGARAAQGVVLITTKRGLAGATRYSLNATYSANDVTKGFPLQTSFGQGDGVPGNAQGTCYTLDCVASRSSWGPRLGAAVTTYDHFAELWETGSALDVALSISGGDDRRSFYFSGGYTGTNGIVVGPNDTYNRATIRLKGSQTMGDRIRLGVNISYVNSWGKFIERGNNRSGMMLDGMRTSPEFNNHYYLDSTSGLHRSYRFPNPSVNSDTLSRGYDNPFWSAYLQPASSTLERFYGNLDLNWNPNDWLTFQWTPGLDYYVEARNIALPFTSSNSPYGFVYKADYSNLILSSVITLIAQHTFTPDFAGSLTLGNEINSTNSAVFQAGGTPLIAPSPLVLANTQLQTASDNQAIIHRQSFFGQATADLWDQLYLTVAIRNDGSSAFAQNDARAWYPKASVAWTFSRSLQLSGQDALQYGKLRAAYGETGKEPGVYSTLNSYQIPGSGVPGLISTGTLGTDSLRPERQKEFETGVDLGFFNGMVDLGFTYYDSHARDVIIFLPLAPASGASGQWVNAGAVTNTGYELTLNVNSPSSSKTVAWTLGLVWAQNRNTVNSVNGANEAYVNSYILATVARPGYVTGAFEGNDFIRCGNGVILDGREIDREPGLCEFAPKGALYIAANGFPVLDDSLRILGSYQPNWQGGVHGSVTIRQKLQFSFLVDIRNGGQAYDGTRGALYFYGTHKDTDIRGSWQKFGASNWYPGPVVGPGAGIPVVIDQSWFEGDGSSVGNNTADFIENSGFTKLREVAVQYTWTGKWVTRDLGLASVVLRLAGRNLATWTGYRGIDPESNIAGAAVAVQGVDWFNNPQARSLVFSVGLNK